MLYHRIKYVFVFVCLYVCPLQAPNHTHYGDEAFKGDSMGLE